MARERRWRSFGGGGSKRTEAHRLFAERAAAFRSLKHEPGLLAATEIDVPEESVLQTLFRAEPRTARSEERRKRLP